MTSNPLPLRFERARVPACPVCSAEAPAAFLETRDHDTGADFRWARCPRCSHRYLVDPPTPADLPKFYEQAQGTLMRKGGAGLLSKLHHVLFGLELGRYLSRESAGARIVDVGGGNGLLAGFLEQKGFRTRIVDVAIAPEIRERFDAVPCDLNFLDGSTDVLSVDGRPADLVVLRHVLEHVSRPVELVAGLKRSGARRALFIVPNAESPFSRVLGRFWAYWDPPRHLHCFTRASLRAALERAGVSSVRIRTEGADEAVVSLNRALRLAGRGSGMLDRWTSAKSPLSIASHALSYFLLPTVLVASVEL